MSMMVLCIEDDPSLIDAFNNSISDLKDNDIDINGVAVKMRDEALEFVGDNNLIGVIVDLNLGDDGATSGVTFIEELAKNFNKIPIAIYSGTVADLNVADEKILSSLCIKTYKKDETSYDEIIQRFIKISDTGINKILGDKGIIEKKLFDIFQKEILPNIDSWIESQSGKNLEEPFTRHAINYLHQIIDTNHKDYLSIEYYLDPKIIDETQASIQTGSIYVNGKGQNYFVITPACDLASKGSMYIHLLLIESKKIGITRQFPNTDHVDDLSAYTPKQQKQIREKLYGNKEHLYQHYLPKVEGVFDGGFINFRDITTTSSDQIQAYQKKLQVSPQFVKDIVSRFSSYYARQGQPELIDKKFR